MSMRTRMLSAAGLALMTAIAVAVWSFGGVQAQEAEPTEPAVVETGTTMLTVRGIATRALTPDQTTIEFEVTSALDETARNAVRAGDRALRAIQSRLRAYRVSDDQLHTQRVSLREEYDWTEQGRVSLGFRYTQSLTLQVEGTDRAGQLIDRIVSAGDGAVSINNVSFLATGRAEAEREVLLAAMDDARATADAMAAQIGKEIVDTIEVTVASALSPVAFVGRQESTSDNEAAADSIAPLIRAGQDDVQVSVVMKFVGALILRAVGSHPRAMDATVRGRSK